MTDLGLALLLLLTTTAGTAAGYWAAGRRTAAEQDAQRARWGAEKARLDGTIARLEGEFEAQGRSLRHTQGELAEQRRTNRDMDAAIAPVRTGLQDLVERVGAAERARVESQTEIRARLGQMAAEFDVASTDVRNEARRLSRALSRSQHRGSWGEMQLRTLVESAGMLKHVHFQEQDHTSTDEGTLRPDLVVDLAGGRKAVVDAKVPLEAFLAAEDGDSDDTVLTRHADAVAAHIAALAGKEYWRRYNSPEFVILFLPAEGLLSAALTVRPELMQTALDKKVLLATPNTLMAMLHAVAHSWRQAEAADQAREIQQAGEELYRRVQRMAESVAAVGRSIAKSADTYNQLVATLERRVIPAGRRMAGMAIADADLPQATALEQQVRNLDAAKWPTLTDAQALQPEPGAPDDPAGDPQIGDSQTGDSHSGAAPMRQERSA